MRWLTVALLVGTSCTSHSTGPSSDADDDRSITKTILDGPTSRPPQWMGPARLQRPPRRVVSLAPGLTETVFALEAGALVVGTSRFADHPEAATQLPKVGGYTDLNVEAVLALEPDLVLAIPGEMYRAGLETIGSRVPVLVVPGSSVADFLETVRALGRALDREHEAKEVTNRIRRELTQLSRPSRSGPAAAVVYGWSPLYLAGPGSFPDELLALMGARNVVGAGGAWARWSYESLLAAESEVIIDAGGGGSSIPEPVRASQNIVANPSSALLRPGPRLPEAARTIGQLLYGKAPPSER